jgi:tetratricopeptide (TPR) repeat protein
MTAGSGGSHTGHEEAESRLRLAVRELEAGQRPDSLELADACHRLATLLAGRGEPDEAALFYERALVIRLERLGPGHPTLAATLHNLALVREATGQTEEARSLWSRARSLLEGAPDGDVEVGAPGP